MVSMPVLSGCKCAADETSAQDAAEEATSAAGVAAAASGAQAADWGPMVAGEVVVARPPVTATASSAMDWLVIGHHP